MSKLLNGSINLSKLDKTKLFKSPKTGDVYLNVNVWLNDEVDDYGNNASIQQSITKEEREAGEKATYIGNLKEYKPETPANEPVEDTDLPF